jgi:hypothetical protein
MSGRRSSTDSQGRVLVAGQSASTLVLLAVAFVATVTLLGTLGVKGAFVPPPTTPEALSGDAEWANEATRIHDAAAAYLAAAKAVRQADADNQLAKWGNACTVANSLPTPISDAAKASAKYIQSACAALAVAPKSVIPSGPV